VIPSQHDHVGHMVYLPQTASCTDCGAEWLLAERGWVCVQEGRRA
jgi:hypothetical protein